MGLCSIHSRAVLLGKLTRTPEDLGQKALAIVLEGSSNELRQCACGANSTGMQSAGGGEGQGDLSGFTAQLRAQVETCHRGHQRQCIVELWA